MKTIILILLCFRVHAQCIDPVEAMEMAKSREKDSVFAFSIYTRCGGDPEWPYVYKVFTTSKEPFYLSEKLGDMVGHVRNAVYAQQGIAVLEKLGKVEAY